MKVIELTRGFATIVDDEDFEELAQYRWYAHTIRGLTYAARKRNGRRVKMHNVIMGFSYLGTVDHHNGNTLDNRRLNLRAASDSQQACNRGVRRTSKTGFKGVFIRANGKFVAQIGDKGGKKVHLGYFKTAEEAHAAYCAAATKLHGEFARFN